MNYLSQFQDKFGKGYHLYVIHHPTIFHILYEWIRDYPPPDMVFKSLFDENLFQQQQQHLILSSKIHDSLCLSISQMMYIKNILLDLHLSNHESITILYFVEHVSLLQNNDFFPDELINGNKWSVHYLPKVETPINKLDVFPNLSDRLFNSFSQCLYDEKHYKQIFQQNMVKENTHLLELNLHENMENLCDMIKYGSMTSIQNEKKNADMIHSNLTADFIYPIRKIFCLQGEYTGAICACADTFDFKFLKSILKIPQNYDDLKKIFNELFAALDKLYSLSNKTNQYKPIEKYMEKIIDMPLEIISLQKPFETTEENVSKLNWDDLFKMDNPKKDFTLKLLDIIPDFTDKNKCKMIFGVTVQTNETSIICHVSYINKDSLWRENFRASGIEAGKNIKIKKVRFENFYSYFVDILAELQFIKEKNCTTPIEEFKHKFRDEIEHKEYMRFNEKDYLNPLGCIKDVRIIERLINDHFKLAHGNISLDNILLINRLNKDVPRLIDISKMATDYPASFDMVTLEMEIKSHIIANHLLIEYDKTEKEKLIDLLIQIEEYIHSEGKNTNLLEQPVMKLSNHMKSSLYGMIYIILFIRKKAFARYKQSSTEHTASFNRKVKIRYYQQLFFYSIRMFEYANITKPSRYFAAITTIVTANRLFGKHDQSNNYETVQSARSYLKKSIFISYSHRDNAWLNRFTSGLDVLKHKNIQYWFDKGIKPGAEWELKIQTEIERADLALCLISNNFLQSDYIRDVEIPAILQKKQEGLIIIPVLLDNCTWQQLDWLTTIQMYPPECKPMSDCSDSKQKEYINDIVNEVADALS